MKTSKLKFPKEKKDNIRLCDEAYLLICDGKGEEGLTKYKKAAENASPRGAFMFAFLCYINDMNGQAVEYFEYASKHNYPLACGFLLEMLNDELNNSRIIEYGKNCVCYYPQLIGKNAEKILSKSVALKELNEIDLNKLVVYCLKEVAATIFFSGNRRLKEDFFDCAELGSKLGDYQCSLLLAKCWIDDNFVSRDKDKARHYLTVAVEQGVDHKNNQTFIEVFKDLQRAEKEQQKIDIAKGNLQQQRDFNRKMDRYSSFIGFCDWLSENSDNLFTSDTPQSVTGEVVLEKTATGGQYVFYNKDDTGRTKGERLKNYDALLGKGETESGTIVTKK